MSAQLVSYLLAMPRMAKRVIALCADVLCCAGTVIFAFYLRLNEWPDIDTATLTAMAVSVAIALPLFITFGLYRAIFRHAGAAALGATGQAVAIYSVVYAIIFTTIGIEGIPRTVGLIQPLLLLLAVGGTRAFVHLAFGSAYKTIWTSSSTPRVLIYGAGSAGRQLASAIRASKEMVLAGFIDDDPELENSTMNGVRIYGPRSVGALVVQYGVTDILLAIPSANRQRRTQIVHDMKEHGLHVRTLPGLMDIARGTISTSDLKELDIEDLLGRAPVPPDRALLAKNITSKVVLVTGAGGSIGSELCRQIAAAEPATLILVDNSEYNLYAINQELAKVCAQMGDQGFALVPLLASICDGPRMERIIATWRPNSIFHAAAYKHVPLVEHNAADGVRNNAIGTLQLATIARDYEVGSFILVSTDKAVRPTNIMGTSKRLAEMILQAFQEEGCSTRFSMVRFGNVLGSSGSVVPLFRSQIAAGGPLTITHRDIIRYFMTIPEAAQLVLQAGAMAEGGEVFVLDMGEPVRIFDLARNMIELSGLNVRDDDNPNGDIAIEVVGLRPGEKLYEELLIGEGAEQTRHPRILRANERFLRWAELGGYIGSLKGAIDAGDANAIRSILREVVPEYKPSSDVVDLVVQTRAVS